MYRVLQYYISDDSDWVAEEVVDDALDDDAEVVEVKGDNGEQVVPAYNYVLHRHTRILNVGTEIILYSIFQLDASRDHNVVE